MGDYTLEEDPDFIANNKAIASLGIDGFPYTTNLVMDAVIIAWRIDILSFWKQFELVNVHLERLEWIVDQLQDEVHPHQGWANLNTVTGRAYAREYHIALMCLVSARESSFTPPTEQC